MLPPSAKASHRSSAPECRTLTFNKQGGLDLPGEDYPSKVLNSKPHRIAENFREDPLIVALLRKAITTVAHALPDLPATLFQDLLLSYREVAGERSHAQFSVAKTELDQHIAKFRSQYALVLSSYLSSQMDRIQGREAAWPLLDADAPGLVPDAAIERRLVVEGLIKIVDVEAEEGVQMFDALLCEALGREPSVLRDNPLRPAAFFHAIGLNWSRASGVERDELLVLRGYGPILGPRIAKIYPEMTAILRTGLNRPKPNSSLPWARGLQAGEAMYARRNEPDQNLLRSLDDSHSDGRSDGNNNSHSDGNNDGHGDGQNERRNDHHNPGHIGTNDDAPGQRRADTPASKQRHSDAPFSAAKSALSTIEIVASWFDAALADSAIPLEARLMLSRIQTACTKRAILDPSALRESDHPMRKMLRDLCDSRGWRKRSGGNDALDAIVMQMGVIRELLNRDRRDSQQDAALYDYLRGQFLALRSSPMPAFDGADEDLIAATAASEKSPTPR